MGSDVASFIVVGKLLKWSAPESLRLENIPQVSENLHKVVENYAARKAVSAIFRGYILA